MNSQEGGVVRVKVVRKGTIVEGERPKEFQFDHAFWSHSREGNDPDCPFIDQQNVFLSLGLPVVQNVLEGFNSSLFAYGQTGSGKTYSMLGFTGDEGLTPRVSQHLFENLTDLVGDGASSFTKFSVECSYLEIYNEQVMDLLTEATPGSSGALKVRQHPSRGVFVEGLRAQAVHNHEDVLALLGEGDKRRRVAQTNMNATSSRSHAMLFLHVTLRDDQGTVSRTSKLSLVDLAGSERASSTGAEGDTLVEGANINRSLTVLGMCLDRLADQASEQSAGKGKKQSLPVPYRDSQLTFLLSESLGGNAKSTMLANISPADVNADETLSTLRFAQVAKRVKSKAIVNESAAAKLIRELKGELASLKKHLGDAQTKREQALSDARLRLAVMPPPPAPPTRAEPLSIETGATISVEPPQDARTAPPITATEDAPSLHVTSEGPTENTDDGNNADNSTPCSDAQQPSPLPDATTAQRNAEYVEVDVTHDVPVTSAQVDIAIGETATTNEQELLQAIEERMKALAALQEEGEKGEGEGSAGASLTSEPTSEALYNEGGDFAASPDAHDMDVSESYVYEPITEEPPLEAAAAATTTSDGTAVFVDWNAPQVVCMNEYVGSVVQAVPNGRAVLAVMSPTEWGVRVAPGNVIDLVLTFSPIMAAISLSRLWKVNPTHVAACEVLLDGVALLPQHSNEEEVVEAPEESVLVTHNARLTIQWTPTSVGVGTRHALHFRFSNVLSLPSAPLFSTTINAVSGSPVAALRHLQLLESFGRLALLTQELEALDRVAAALRIESVNAVESALALQDVVSIGRRDVKRDMFFVEEELSRGFPPTSREVAEHLRVSAAATKLQKQQQSLKSSLTTIDSSVTPKGGDDDDSHYNRIAHIAVLHSGRSPSAAANSSDATADDDESDGEDVNEGRQMKLLFEEVDALREANRLREEEQQQTHVALQAQIDATRRERRNREQSIMVRKDKRPVLRQHVDVMTELMNEVQNDSFALVSADVVAKALIAQAQEEEVAQVATNEIVSSTHESVPVDSISIPSHDAASDGHSQHTMTALQKSGDEIAEPSQPLEVQVPVSHHSEDGPNSKPAAVRDASRTDMSMDIGAPSEQPDVPPADAALDTPGPSGHTDATQESHLPQESQPVQPDGPAGAELISPREQHPAPPTSDAPSSSPPPARNDTPYVHTEEDQPVKRRQRMTTIIADDAIDDSSEGLVVPMHENSMFIEGAGVGSGFTPIDAPSAAEDGLHAVGATPQATAPSQTSSRVSGAHGTSSAQHPTDLYGDASPTESITSLTTSTDATDTLMIEEELRWLQASRDSKQVRPNGPLPRDHPEAAEDLGLWHRFATDPKEKLPFLREILLKQLDYYWARHDAADVHHSLECEDDTNDSSLVTAPTNTSFFASVAAPLTATTRSTGSDDPLAVNANSKRLLPSDEQRAGYLWKLNQGATSHKWEYRFGILSGRFLYYFYSADGTCRCLAALYLYGAIINAVDQLEGKNFVIHIQTTCPRWLLTASTPQLPTYLRTKLELEVRGKDYSFATCATVVPGTSPHWLISPSKWPSGAEASPKAQHGVASSPAGSMTDSFSGLLKEKHLHWTPDETSLTCSACSQPFSFFRRRHHCRACGLVFCDACTKTVDMLNERNEMKKKRACNKCVAASVSRIGRGSLLESEASRTDRSESLVVQGTESAARLAGQSPVVTAEPEDNQFAV
ncbi:kinesin-like protein, putative [Bodo saltans]|uniref:Kinesin-like protein, putative n=1 Tax=Bodo saltans TaxID=75058 RepID=A0A0S4KHX4_BODSA|nr:kinesin-like protein, putative [Bodo saltans]|eukprot:CUI14120.1 kinesin-like protein, putative [Bodo saltans]